MSENANDKQKINLRDLDDVSCSNVVVSRQIRHLIKKNPSFSDITIDCWIHDGHYTRFKWKNNKFYWYSENNEPHLEGLECIDNKTDCLYNDEWNKLIVFTHRSMCESLNGIDIEDTPEDLLVLAESKLQELLNSDDEYSLDSKTLANQVLSKDPGYAGAEYNNNLFHKLAGR